MCCGLFVTGAASTAGHVADPPIGLTFVDRTGAPVDFATDVSHPHPVVTLEEVDVADVTSNLRGRTATLRIRGTVTCAIADIVENNEADIRTVHICFTDNHLDPDHAEIAMPVTVKRDAGEPTSSLRPFAFKGTFSKQVAVPLFGSVTMVRVLAWNVIGEEGSDDFAIHLHGERLKMKYVAALDSDGNEYVRPYIVSVPREAVEGVSNDESTREGFANPIRVFIDDKSIDSTNAGSVSADFFGQSQKLTIIDGQLQIDRPFMQVAAPVPGHFKNVRNAIDRPDKTTVTYKGQRKTLDWAYAAHDLSEPPAVQPARLGGTACVYGSRPRTLRLRRLWRRNHARSGCGW